MAEISLDIAASHPAAWRNFYRQRALNRLGPDAPAQVVVEQLLPRPVKLTITAVNTNEGQFWRGVLEEGTSSRQFLVDAPDGRDQMQPLAALLTGLTNVRVKNFLADTAPGPETMEWTAFPAWRFSIRSADGRDLPGLTLYAADAKGALPGGMPYVDGEGDSNELVSLPGQESVAGMAFSIPEREAVLETFGELAYLLCLPPYRYQSRRLVSMESKKWSGVEIRHADVTGTVSEPVIYTRNPREVNEQWWRAGDVPEPLMDDNNRFVGVLLELSQLRAEAFVQDAGGDIAKFGLDRPEITVIVYSSSEEGEPVREDARLFALTLGAEADASGRRYAAWATRGRFFLFPLRWPRLLVKITDKMRRAECFMVVWMKR